MIKRHRVVSSISICSPCVWDDVDIVTNYPDEHDGKWEESVVDPSYFVPTAESVKCVNSTPLSPSEVARSFDFRDGKDNGMAVPLSRKRGLDLADVSMARDKAVAELEESAAEAKMESDIKAAYSDTSNLTAAIAPVSDKSVT
ncbi:hypothetical protein [Tortoise microvirus 66]|nr:hypothetical protein [Tortoise microvirus 66]